MANLTRWNPMREMAAMQSALDRLFENSLRGWQGEDVQGMLALDVDETDDAYTVRTALPGVKPENVNIQIQNDMLTIDGEIPEQTTEKKNARSVMKERYYGRFSRTIRLPQPVNRDKVEALLENGILTLTLPKSPEAQPRMIQIKSQSGKK